MPMEEKCLPALIKDNTIEFTFKGAGREIVRVLKDDTVNIAEDATIEELKDVTKRLALLISHKMRGAVNEIEKACNIGHKK